MQLDGIGARLARAGHSNGVRVDEQTHAHTKPPKSRYPVAKLNRVTRHVQAALRGDLLTPLGHERHLVGTNSPGDRQHFVRERHLEIDDAAHRLGQPLDIVVLDVPPILAKVGGDPVCPGVLANRRSDDRVRVHAAARLTECGDMIHVDV